MTTNNTGRENSGYCNSGYCNSGNWNSGNCNSGNCNSGNWNSGNWNSGNWNSGDRNSGYCNSGNWNSGYWNSDQPKVRMFNKMTEKEFGDISFPDFFYYTLTEWIVEDEMTDKEKDAYPSYITCKGYLKVYTHEQAWRNAWDKADKEDRKKCLDLPNWDNEIFKEISGIDVEKELHVKNTVQEFTIKEIAEKLGVDVSTLRIKE